MRYSEVAAAYGGGPAELLEKERLCWGQDARKAVQGLVRTRRPRAPPRSCPSPVENNTRCRCVLPAPRVSFAADSCSLSPPSVHRSSVTCSAKVICMHRAVGARTRSTLRRGTSAHCNTLKARDFSTLHAVGLARTHGAGVGQDGQNMHLRAAAQPQSAAVRAAQPKKKPRRQKQRRISSSAPVRAAEPEPRQQPLASHAPQAVAA